MVAEPQPLKVLVVDDEPLLALTLCKALTKAGMHAISAKDGNEALELAAEHAPDVIFLDIIMPRKEGVETLLALRRRGSSAKVITISSGAGLNNVTLLDSTGLLGADLVLPKPFRMARAIEAVHEVMAKSGVKPRLTLVAAERRA